MSKVNNAESEKRVTEIFNLLVLGTSRADILQYCAKKRLESDGAVWDVETRQIDVYIKKARENLAKIAEYKRNEQLGIALERLNTLYKNNLKVQDYKGALAVQREINTLLGLHAPQEVRHTGKDGGVLTFKLTFDNRDDN